MEGEVEKLKKCGGCKGEKKFADFPLNKTRYDGLNQICFQCMKEERELKQGKVVEQRIKEQFIDGEIWKVIPGFSKYEASSLGRIRNIKKKLLIKPAINEGGYCKNSLTDDNNKFITKSVHQLVALTFIDNPENKKTVNHENKIRNDNSVENLSWATSEEQQKHVWTVNPPKIKQKPKIKNLSDINGEIWKIIPTYPLYSISNFGRIKYSIKRKNLITKITEGDLINGYKCFTIKNNDGKKCIGVHRLVAETFILNPLNKQFVNHEDGIKTNNHVGNLSWATPSENSQHAHDNGLNSGKKKIYQLNEKNEIIQEWNSQVDAADGLKIGKLGISKCLRKVNKTAGGFYWVYKNDYDENNKIVVRGTEKGKLNQINIETKQIINTFLTIGEAVKVISTENGKNYSANYDGIRTCLKGDRKTSQGYIWKYESNKTVAEEIKKIKKPKLNQIDIKTNQIIKSWESSQDAGKYFANLTGKKYVIVKHCITSCIRGDSKTSHGYIWKYESENENEYNKNESDKTKNIKQNKCVIKKSVIKL